MIHHARLGALRYCTGSALGCRSCIIHAFLVFFAQSHPATVFRLTMSFFAFFCPTVFSLGFSVGVAFRSTTTRITAVGLPPPATLADTENFTTPTALNFP